ncbi:type VII secretion integral membrane protein EccD [Serinibacter arcticus]|uniref:Type VII secretion integral membrane protein EccD n=1 Tax=Serinibacter arcticus TaxID=1655435 RepID=A0A2U1ZUB4_9MICO|nr:EsaB/YukD family protein [Serinibacter arcticus]PWD50522.1 type VII secretion integral membrane protein EccD [Serinibacter arcticus]
MTVPAPAPSPPGGEAGSAGGALVRVTVAAGPRRADLTLPAEVPLVEVLPGLARTLGQLEVTSAHTGLELVTAQGRRLGGDVTLGGAGVPDGAVLTLAAAQPRAGNARYDDVVEAVADVVESGSAPWSPQDAARAAVGVAAVFLVTGGAVLAVSGLGAVLTASLGGAGALLALVTAVVLERTGAPRTASLTIGVVAALLAGTAAFLGLDGLARLDDGAAAFALAAGGGAILAVAAALAALAPGVREAMVAPAITGAVGLAVGGVTAWRGADTAPVVTVVAFAVVACALVGVPWLALTATPLRVVTPRDDREVLDDVPPVDIDAVREQAATGQRLQIAMRAGAGAALLGLTPGVAASGVAGLLLTAVGFGALLLTVRESRARGDVAVVTATGAGGFLLAVLTAALTQPTWRPALVVVLLGGAFAVVIVALLVSGRQLRLARAADVAQLVLLAALPPLAVVAAGAMP